MVVVVEEEEEEEEEYEEGSLLDQALLLEAIQLSHRSASAERIITRSSASAISTSVVPQGMGRSTSVAAVQPRREQRKLKLPVPVGIIPTIFNILLFFLVFLVPIAVAAVVPKILGEGLLIFGTTSTFDEAVVQGFHYSSSFAAAATATVPFPEDIGLSMLDSSFDFDLDVVAAMHAEGALSWNFCAAASPICFGTNVKNTVENTSHFREAMMSVFAKIEKAASHFDFRAARKQIFQPQDSFSMAPLQKIDSANVEFSIINSSFDVRVAGGKTLVQDWGDVKRSQNVGAAASSSEPIWESSKHHDNSARPKFVSIAVRNQFQFLVGNIIEDGARSERPMLDADTSKRAKYLRLPLKKAVTNNSLEYSYGYRDAEDMPSATVSFSPFAKDLVLKRAEGRLIQNSVDITALALVLLAAAFLVQAYASKFDGSKKSRSACSSCPTSHGHSVNRRHIVAILVLLLIPMVGCYQMSGTTELRTAVTAWCNDQTTASATYGDMATVSFHREYLHPAAL